jgi:hypothetical protein
LFASLRMIGGADDPAPPVGIPAPPVGIASALLCQ